MLFMIRKFLANIDFSGRRQHERMFAGRSPLSSDEFYEKYFSDQGFKKDIVVRIKNIFNAKVGFDLSRLSADDDFSTELQYIWDHDSLADVEILVALEKEFVIKITDEEAKRMHTIRDVVQIISAKTQNGN